MHAKRPTRLLLPRLLQLCGRRVDFKTGQSLHSFVIRSSLDDAFVVSSLVDMYSRCGHANHARRAFHEARERDTVVWNSMMACYSRMGLPSEAMKVFVDMVKAGSNPDLTSWNTLISAFSSSGFMKNAVYFFNLMDLYGFKPDLYSWASIIAGFVRGFFVEEALESYRRMVFVEMPGSAAISAILPVFSLLADLRRGASFHGHSVLVGVEEEVYVSSALLDMYCKCGSLGDAAKVFDKMPERSNISWNSMIFGYANNGVPCQALALFEEMKKAGGKPDHLTMTAVLTACSHGGLVELGSTIFDSMEEEWNMVPRVEHYACLVDLLGRAGRLERALEVVKEMPVAPDRFVWGALLGACRMHGEVEIAAAAARWLIRLNSERRGCCLLVSDILAGFGRWEESRRVKMMSKGRGLRGLPACSWVTTG